MDRLGSVSWGWFSQRWAWGLGNYSRPRNGRLVAARVQLQSKSRDFRVWRYATALLISKWYQLDVTDKAGGHDEIAWGRRFRFAFKTLMGTQPVITASYGPSTVPHVKHTHSAPASNHASHSVIRRVVSAPINARTSTSVSPSSSYLSSGTRSNCSTPISVDSDDEEEERRTVATSYKTGHISSHSISIPIVAGRRYSVQS